jgi:hypothetical protein
MKKHGAQKSRDAVSFNTGNSSNLLGQGTYELQNLKKTPKFWQIWQHRAWVGRWSSALSIRCSPGGSRFSLLAAHVVQILTLAAVFLTRVWHNIENYIFFFNFPVTFV